MKLGTFGRAAFVLAGSLAAAAAVAQSVGGTSTPLNIPDSLQFRAKQDPNVVKATAIVNSDVLTRTDVDHRIALIMIAQQGMEIPPDELERVRAQILRNLIDETLQIQAAAARDIKIEQTEIDAYFAQFARGNGHTPQSFAQFLRANGSSERSIKRQIHGEMAWARLQRRQIEPFVSVGDDEVKAILDRMNASKGTREFRISEIFLSATPETAAEARTNASRIVQQLRAGASFVGYARQFSEASTAAVGGDLGWIRPEMLPAELGSYLPQMPLGGVSDPIPVPGGFSIIQVADTRQFMVADPRDAVLSLIQLSLNMPQGATQAQVDQRANQFAQAVQGMGGCGRATETAQRLGAELITNDQVRVRDLPPPLQAPLLDLAIGQATSPFGSTERLSVLVLCGRDDPGESRAPTFDQVYAQLNDERVNRRSQRLLRDLRRDAVIDYR